MGHRRQLAFEELRAFRNDPRFILNDRQIILIDEILLSCCDLLDEDEHIRHLKALRDACMHMIENKDYVAYSHAGLVKIYADCHKQLDEGSDIPQHILGVETADDRERREEIEMREQGAYIISYHLV